MNEKYSTTDLLGWLVPYLIGTHDMRIDAIIARLRAADALCEEAKFPRNGRVVELRKAIAEYENSHD